MKGNKMQFASTALQIADNFWASYKEVKIIHPQTDETFVCWEWQRYVTKWGYGQVQVNGRLEGAHRYAWMLSTGKSIPNKMNVLHKCDNRRCINPDHLMIGTQSENIKQAVQRGRFIPPIFSGENHPAAMVTDKQRSAIRDIYFNKKLNQREISELCGIRQTTVSYIVRQDPRYKGRQRIKS